MITLRDYQSAAVSAVEEHLNAEGRFLIAMAMGTGKSICIAAAAQKCAESKGKCLILVHSAMLVAQNAKAFKQLTGKFPTILHAPTAKRLVKKGEATEESVIISTPQMIKAEDRLRAVAEFFQGETMIVDEVHWSSTGTDSEKAKSYGQLFERIKPARVFGFSATPFANFRLNPAQKLALNAKDEGDEEDPEYTRIMKLSSRLMRLDDLPNLRDKWDEIIYEFGYWEAVQAGWLTPIMFPKTTKIIEYGHLDKSDFADNGEIRGSVQSNAVLEVIPVITDFLVAHFINTGEQALVFTPTKETANALEESCNCAVPNSAVSIVSGKTGAHEALELFKAKELPLLINVGMATTGIDIPALENIVLARHIMSAALFQQICGRATRIAEGKQHAKVWDIGGTLARLEKENGKPDNSILTQMELARGFKIGELTKPARFIGEQPTDEDGAFALGRELLSLPLKIDPPLSPAALKPLPTQFHCCGNGAHEGLTISRKEFAAAIKHGSSLPTCGCIPALTTRGAFGAQYWGWADGAARLWAKHASGKSALIDAYNPSANWQDDGQRLAELSALRSNYAREFRECGGNAKALAEWCARKNIAPELFEFLNSKECQALLEEAGKEGGKTINFFRGAYFVSGDIDGLRAYHAKKEEQNALGFFPLISEIYNYTIDEALPEGGAQLKSAINFGKVGNWSCPSCGARVSAYKMQCTSCCFHAGNYARIAHNFKLSGFGGTGEVLKEVKNLNLNYNPRPLLKYESFKSRKGTELLRAVQRIGGATCLVQPVKWLNEIYGIKPAYAGKPDKDGNAPDLSEFARRLNACEADKRYAITSADSKMNGDYRNIVYSSIKAPRKRTSESDFSWLTG